MSESTIRKIKKNVNLLQGVRPSKASQYRATADAIIDQYANREITNFKTAMNFILKLGSKRPEVSKAKFDAYLNANKPITAQKSRLDVGVNDEPVGKVAKQKTTLRSTPVAKPSIKKKVPQKLTNFFIRANVKTSTTYERTHRNRTTKQMYTHQHSVPNFEYINKTITATSESKARAIFADSLTSEIINHDNYKSNTTVDDINIVQIEAESSFQATPTKSMMMKSARVIDYDFIPENQNLLKNEGYCVRDNFVGTYGKLIKKLTMDYFTGLCYEVRGEVKPNEQKMVSLLDRDINDDDYEAKSAIWTINDGVSPEMLWKICQKLNISHYGFDYGRKCFLKHIATHHNYPALVYYAVDGHMYHITDRKAVDSLTKSARDIQTKMNSSAMSVDDERKNIFAEDLEIKENIPVAELKDLDNCIVMYSKNDLTEELDDIIRIYNFIPQVRNKKSNHVKIIFDYGGKIIYLVVDPNDPEICDYKRIRSLCTEHKVEFKNQSFSQFINQIKNKHYDTSVQRHKFTKAERDDIYATQKECKMCNAKVSKGKFHLDHIVALANGGNNEITNIQVLCSPCHLQKTKYEKEEGYVKLVPTESSFNTVVKDIFNSKLCGSFAFIHR